MTERLVFEWSIVEGGGHLERAEAEIVVCRAGPDPGMSRLRRAVRHGETQREAEALITVTAELLPDDPVGAFRGAPGRGAR